MSATGVDAALERSDLLRAALSLARQAHAGQTRDTGNGELPFIEHPLAVAERLAECGCPDEVLAAGLLHDAVENGAVELGELRERFGDTIAHLVGALTEDATIPSYEERKDEHRRRVSEAGPEALTIFAADKLVNLETLRSAYAVRGEDVDRNLQVPLHTKIHTWELDLEMLSDRVPELELVSRLADRLEALRRERAEPRASSG